MRVETLDLDEWESALPDTGYEVFHRPEALRVLDDHTQATLRLFGGFKGEQPIGLLPVFVRRYGPARVVASPPPAMNVPRLGPVLMPTSPKRRKRERVNRTFTEEVLEAIEADSARTLLRMDCNAAYPDPRPYRWNDLEIETRFTYALDATAPPDEIMSSFSKSLRREIRDAKDLDVTVSVEGIPGAREVFEETRDRYEQQGEPHHVEWPYVRDLVTALDDRCRTYVARDDDGEFIGGITALYSNDTAYFWQGGTRAVHEETNVSLNGLIHWRIIEDIAAGEPLESVTAYDLMGANTERLCQYKSKFDAELVPYFAVETSSPGMKAAKRAYRALYR